jgi:hypothetical protein
MHWRVKQEDSKSTSVSFVSLTLNSAHFARIFSQHLFNISATRHSQGRVHTIDICQAIAGGAMDFLRKPFGKEERQQLTPAAAPKVLVWGLRSRFRDLNC